MSQPAVDPRLAFFETREPRLPPDAGPSIHHRLHGNFALNYDTELRVTTQRERSPDRPARILIRRWFRKRDGTWWPISCGPGVEIPVRNAREFLLAVSAAVEAIESDGKARE